MDPLTPAQTDELAAQLLAVRDALTAQLAATEDDAKPVDLNLPIGRLSRMDAIQQQQMSQAGRSASKRRLIMVESALESVKNGEYGYCRECAEPVGFPRLNARPETPFCITCQSSLEQG